MDGFQAYIAGKQAAKDGMPCVAPNKIEYAPDPICQPLRTELATLSGFDKAEWIRGFETLSLRRPN